jgi:GNAT superfamily N-acetyltransferase
MRDTEFAEVAAFREQARGLPGAGGFRSAGGALAVRCPLAGTELNRILGLESLNQLDELEPLFAGGRFAVSLDPETRLEPTLRERGFEPGYPWQKFVREPEPLRAATELSVEAARRPEDFAHAAVHGYGLPADFEPWAAALVGRAGWHCLVAYDGETPVGTGALYVAGHIGWLGVGATLPEHRGRGAQSAILAARISLAHELGLRSLVTETGVPRDGQPGPSYRNILRAGFRETYVRPNLAKGDP